MACRADTAAIMEKKNLESMFVIRIHCHLNLEKFHCPFRLKSVNFLRHSAVLMSSEVIIMKIVKTPIKHYDMVV